MKTIDVTKLNIEAARLNDHVRAAGVASQSLRNDAAEHGAYTAVDWEHRCIVLVSPGDAENPVDTYTIVPFENVMYATARADRKGKL